MKNAQSDQISSISLKILPGSVFVRKLKLISSRPPGKNSENNVRVRCGVSWWRLRSRLSTIRGFKMLWIIRFVRCFSARLFFRSWLTLIVDWKAAKEHGSGRRGTICHIFGSFSRFRIGDLSENNREVWPNCLPGNFTDHLVAAGGHGECPGGSSGASGALWIDSTEGFLSKKYSKFPESARYSGQVFEGNLVRKTP